MEVIKGQHWYRGILILIVFSCSSFRLFAQDVPISQYYSNLVYLNPAFAGVLPDQRLNFFYRNQWPFAQVGYQSYGFAYDTYVDKINGGLGVMLTNESFGANYAPSIDIIYTHGVEILKGWYINMGVQAGIVQKIRGDYDYDFEENESIRTGLNKLYPDFAVGFVTFYHNVYGGFSIDHFARPDQSLDVGSSLSRIDRKYTLHFGFMKYFNTRLLKEQRVLSPNILIQIQGLEQNINWGTSFQYDYIVGGIWVRHNLYSNVDAMIFSGGIKTLNYKVAYSYDMNVGKKVSGGFGAHEISFTYLVSNNKTKKHKGIKCPTFLQ